MQAAYTSKATLLALASFIILKLIVAGVARGLGIKVDRLKIDRCFIVI
jgi:hypothetical protein